MNVERFRWFDRWLKDVDNGVDNDDSVRIFVMGGGSGNVDERGVVNHGGVWRLENEWPLERTVCTNYYLGQEGTLSTTLYQVTQEQITWIHDPQNPVPTVSGNVTGFYEWITLPEDVDKSYVPQRARMKSLIPDGPLHQQERDFTVGSKHPYKLLSDRNDVNVFQTEPLQSEVEVTGAIKVNLWISSNSLDTDFTAKLLDVFPADDRYSNGFHMPLADSIKRARFRDGYEEEKLMSPNKIYLISIQLPPISNLFSKGHRIRLDIASSNFPRFDVNPNTGEPIGQHTYTRHSVNNVHTGINYPSSVVLPIIPN